MPRNQTCAFGGTPVTLSSGTGLEKTDTSPKLHPRQHVTRADLSESLLFSLLSLTMALRGNQRTTRRQCTASEDSCKSCRRSRPRLGSCLRIIEKRKEKRRKGRKKEKKREKTFSHSCHTSTRVRVAESRCRHLHEHDPVFPCTVLDPKVPLLRQ